MHILCPHCHNPIEVVKLTPHEEIACPSCGSSFRLETDATTDQEHGSLQKLGRFELEGIVGRGAFGTVYKARDSELDRTVAVKMPRTGNLAGPHELDRFLREARSAAQLRHPSIVTVHEVGERDGLPYLVSDFVQGVTLADLLSARRPGFRDAAELVAAIADALQYAHEQGVVHRDVKPSNVMIGDDGKPFVMDFGLAKREAGEITMTVEGQVLGTPAYMSPEQARGEGHVVDGRCDVYSLGVVFYQMLTGELPFRGTQRMLLHQVLHDEPRSLRSLNDRIPRDLETICLKAMAKEPARRYQTARDLADDLRRWLKGEPIKARPIGRMERALRWARRRPAAAALVAVSGVAALALVAVVVGGLYHWQLRRANDELHQANDRTETALQAEAEARLAEEKQKQRAEAALYFNRIVLAEREWWANNAGRARQLLEESPPNLHGWEWGYLNRLFHQELRTLGHPTKYITNLVFSPDGKWIASTSDDKTVKVWDAVTGELVFTLSGHTVTVTTVAFSPDGRHLFSAGPGKYPGPVEMKLWDIAARRELPLFKGIKEPVYDAAFSWDGKYLATCGGEIGSAEGTVTFWEVGTGKVFRTLSVPYGAVTCLALRVCPIRGVSLLCDTETRIDPFGGTAD
jgi:tRNA A-37 threonylcarbamoyl transferase component Bud32